MTQRIGALTISQSPRHDLTAPLYKIFPDDEIIEVGALDAIDIYGLPDGIDTPYPLTTSLRNGDLVTLDSEFLTPLLQDALDRIEQHEVMATVLLCAGDFPRLIGTMPLIKPSDVTMAIVRAMGIQQIAVISPIDIQVSPIKKKWLDAGFEPIVWVMPDDSTLEEQANWINIQLTDVNVDCVVLDYVGYPTVSTLTLQESVNKFIFDLGHLALSALASLLSSHSR